MPPGPGALNCEQWTVGESNPDLLGASQASFRWTNSPSFSLDSEQRSARESNSVPLLTTEACRRRTRGPSRHRSEQCPPESRTRSPSLQKRDAPGTPTDHRDDRPPNQSSRRESNPRFLFVREVSLPLDHGTLHQVPLSSSTGGSRTHRHQTLSLTAMPVRVPCRRSAELRARELNHGLRVYETRPSAGPPAMESQAPVPSRAAGLMRAGGAPATPERSRTRIAPRGVEPPSPP
jgi:hypothetical protein